MSDAWENWNVDGSFDDYNSIVIIIEYAFRQLLNIRYDIRISLRCRKTSQRTIDINIERYTPKNTEKY